MRLEPVSALARSLGCACREKIPLSGCTSFKIGGPAALVIDAPEPAALQQLLGACREEEVPVLFLGNGSNVLAADSGFPGAVLRLSGGAPVIAGREDGGVLVDCPAGVPLKALCRFAREAGLSGLEFAYGIPGAAGGAVYMNAGAYGGQMSDVLVSAEAVSSDGAAVREVPASAMALGYRHSVLMETGEIVLSVRVRLHPDDKAEIGARMEEFMRRRREKQPLEYPSAGSFFKRPAGYFAGALIEQSGLKGFAVGGAQVSEKHAGFVINRGGATSADVRALAAEVIRRVEADHGVRLEPEVRFLPGNDG